ncbi:BMP family protein [Paenibacillus thailandensis]|uniref:BMP family protein n=1 Tax=Paenibacillus thailandensis TaxID=393250 RepID=A0ABW5R1Q6_9BACL
MKKSGLMLALILSLTLILSACGGGAKNNTNAPAASPSQPAAGESAAPEASKMKIGMSTDTGGVNDKSFNQSAWEALQQIAQDTGATTKYLESKGDADMEPNLRSFVQEKYDLIWGIGFLFSDAMTRAAEQNPDSNFALIDSVVDLPNVTSVTFAEHEGSFLVGVVAGLTTKTNKVGFVGGIESPTIQKFEAGYVAGVKAANPNAEVLIQYAGAFDKPDVGKTIAATQYNDGADIIFQAAGATGTGVFNEAIERFNAGNKVWVIGVDKDQSLEFGNDVTLTSMMKGVKEAVYKVSSDLINGTLEGGKTITLGLKDNGVGLPESNPNVPQDVLDKVNEYKEKIVSGEITVPTTPEE